MDRKTALTIVLVMLAFSVVFSAAASASCLPPTIVQAPHVGNMERLGVSVPLVIGVGIQDNSNSLLNQPTRLEIYNFIKANPGVHFRGICDGLDLSIGVVQYHLTVLENANLVTSHMDGQNKRYFQAGAFTDSEMNLISLVRHQTAGQILTLLSQNDYVLHRDVAQRLGVSSQALTWHMNQLKNSGLINAEKVGVNVKYSLTDLDAVRFALNLTYRLC